MASGWRSRLASNLPRPALGRAQLPHSGSIIYLMEMIFGWFFFAGLALTGLAATAQTRPFAAVSVTVDPAQCRTHVLRKPVLSGMAVRGELSGFDPCHPSVSLTVPAGVEKPPLVISVHGGGGRPDAQAITHAFAESGMATLIFDAYKHNGVSPRSGNA